MQVLSNLLNSSAPLPLSALPAWLGSGLNIALMIFGFGFVVFFHELGHFLAAKYVKIRVEQFAVGFGQAMFSYRKGMGFTWGSSRKKYDALIQKHIEASGPPAELQMKEKAGGLEGYTASAEDKAAEELGLGDTEYRLNWIPLGGYVKMLGQDDLRPNSQASDPRAYNRKSIAARMLVVSAGVIMNIILAAIGFMIIFMIGFNVPPPVVGSIEPFSPAQRAGLHVGDRIVSIDRSWQADFTKILLNVALLKEGESVPFVVRRPKGDGTFEEKTLTVTPDRFADDPKGFLAIGITASPELRGPQIDPDRSAEEDDADLPPDARLIHPGDAIIAINGREVNPNTDYYKLDEALQTYDGTTPVRLTVRAADGKERVEELRPQLSRYGGRAHFGTEPNNVAGMEPRLVLRNFGEKTTVKDQLKIGDVIEELSIGDGEDRRQAPSRTEFVKMVNGAADNNKTLSAKVLRGKEVVTVKDLKPTVVTGKDPQTDKKMHGIGVEIEADGADAPVVSDVIKNGPAARAGLPRLARLVSVDGKPVNNWFQVRSALLAKPVGSHQITYQEPGQPQGQADKTVAMALTEADAQNLKSIRYSAPGLLMTLHEMREPRKTSNPATAAAWGVDETRDFVLQFYVTIKRMFQGSVSAKNVMGPVGMVQAGAKFATKGADWLIWFLAMISANLAVVNFLPIPIVDGGLFTFLVIEKIQGRPASPKTQAVAQMVGLALIVSVFLLVTYQDVARMLGWR